MSVGAVGTACHSEFGLYEVDGVTPRAGASADVSTVLLLDGVVAVEAVVVAEVDGTPGWYVATFTPLSAGKYSVVIRDTAFSRDMVESFDVTVNSIDDVAGDQYVVSVDAVSGLRALSDWAPILIFLRRNTMSLVDIDQDGNGDPVLQVEILSADGATVVETILGAGATRLQAGKYQVVPEQLASSGTYFLRVSYEIDGLGVVDLLRVVAAPPLSDVNGATGVSATIARIYTYPTSLAQAKYDLSALESDEVWHLIRDVSTEIEALTRGNIFNGEYGSYACSARSRRVVYHPLQHWFNCLDEVRIVQENSDRRRDGLYRLLFSTYLSPIVPSTEYTLRAGMVESISRSFPEGTCNVVVKGAIGMLDPAHRAATTSTEGVTAESNSVVVASLTGFAARDVVEVVSDVGAIRFIATGLDVATSSILFDAMGGSFTEIPAGSVVRTFGQVPRGVELVANYLFGVRLRELQSNAAGQEFIPAGRVRRERTDDYEIEFQPLAAADSLTGSPRYDQLLARYLKPIDVRVP